MAGPPVNLLDHPLHLRHTRRAGAREARVEDGAERRRSAREAPVGEMLEDIVREDEVERCVGIGNPAGVGDPIIVVVNLDPYTTREGVVYLDRHSLGLPAPEPGTHLSFTATDEISGETFTWGEHPYIRLNPHGQVAHIVSVEHP